MSNDQIFTDSIHAGQDPDPATGSRAPPIYQTTSYVFDDDEHAAELFALDADPAAYAAAYAGKNIYSRIQNPTTMTLENRLATLEDGIGAITTSSGMAALDLAIFLLAEEGDRLEDRIDELTVSVFSLELETFDLDHRERVWGTHCICNWDRSGTDFDTSTSTIERWILPLAASKIS